MTMEGTTFPVALEVNNGAFVERYDYEPGMQVVDLVRKFQEDHMFRFAADPLVYDSSQGGKQPISWATEIVNDGRTYSMTCWITQQLDPTTGLPKTKTSLA